MDRPHETHWEVGEAKVVVLGNNLAFSQAFGPWTHNSTLLGAEKTQYERDGNTSRPSLILITLVLITASVLNSRPIPAGPSVSSSREHFAH